jgi:spermidine/putrescine transport system permease protein
MGWRLIRIYTMLVYLFMFLPVAVVVLLSFNASQFGSFPMTGLSTRWFVELAKTRRSCGPSGPRSCLA